MGEGAIALEKLDKISCVSPKADDGTRTHDIHLGKVTFYH